MIKRILEIAKETNIHPDTIEKIVRSEFELVKDIIQEGKDASIHLQFWGKYLVKPARRKFMDEQIAPRKLLKDKANETGS